MRSASRFLVPLLLVGFLWAMVAIVLIPVETGDVYPKYSSLRADPLGTRILYDSLSEMPGLRVERNFKNASRLIGAKATILEIGWSGPSWFREPAPVVKEWEAIAASGARLVFVFQPSLPALEANFKVFEQKPSARKPDAPVLLAAVETRWGVKAKLRKAPAKERAAMDRNPRESALYFEPDPTWRVVERGPGELAEYIEKPMGKGSIVLVAQSFRVSNEGLREGVDAAWLSDLLGANARVIFDEFHNGVADTGSVGSLIGRYRLQGSVAVLLLIGILFIWRNASSLLPARENGGAPAGAATRLGRDAQQGLTALLQRNIARADLTKVCFAEWTKSKALRPPVAPERAALAEQQAVAARTPVEAYRAIHHILTDRK